MVWIRIGLDLVGFGVDCLGGLDGKERAKWNTLERGEVQNWVPVDRLEPGIKRWTWEWYFVSSF